MFPLHLKTFNTSFADAINPKLLKLTKSVSYFTFLTNEIDSFKCSLNDVSIYLVNYNPTQKLLELIQDFKTQSYVDVVKSHLEQLIGKLDGKMKYDQIIGHVLSLAKPYNQNLETGYKNFKKKIGVHKESLEQSINQYIQKINKSLTDHRSSVQEFIQSIKNIKSQIDKFSQNYSKIRQSISYHRLDSILKDDKSRFDGTIVNIFLTLNKYRNDSNTFNRTKSGFLSIMRRLNFYSETVSNNKNLDYKPSESGSSIVDPGLNNTLEKLNFYADEFDKYMKKAKLKKISEHILTMKSSLKKVQSSVKPEFKKHIEDLSDIDLDYSEFNQSLTINKKFTDSLIGKLQIAKQAIEFFNTLKGEISKLNGVKFKDYDISEFIKHSFEIKNKLTKFQEQIKSNLKKLRESYEKIQDHTVAVQGDTYDESYYENLISPAQNLIDIILLEISVIRYIVYYLLIIKSNSIIIDFVKKKINEITNIDTAITNLKEILELLRTFYLIHRNSMNMVIIFNFISFARFYIDKYINSLSLVKYYVEILIFAIKCYIVILTVIKFVTSELEKIKPQIKKLISELDETKKLEGYTSNIISSLKSINSSIKSLKRVNDDLDNIKRLKNNILKIKHHIKQVYQNVLEIKVNLNGIIKITIELYNIKSEILKVQKNINDIVIKIISFINYLNINRIFILSIAKNYIITNEKKMVFLIHSISVFNVIENLQSIIKYLNGINSVIDQMGITKFIQNIESQTNNTEMLVKKIESNIDKVDKSVREVECAIEEVCRNLIKCYLQSL